MGHPGPYANSTKQEFFNEQVTSLFDVERNDARRSRACRFG
jgi:hypothetical protein